MDQRKRHIGSMNLMKYVQGWIKEKTEWINEFIVKLSRVDQGKRHIGSMNLKKIVQGWLKEKDTSELVKKKQDQ